MVDDSSGAARGRDGLGVGDRSCNCHCHWVNRIWRTRALALREPARRQASSVISRQTGSRNAEPSMVLGVCRCNHAGCTSDQFGRSTSLSGVLRSPSRLATADSRLSFTRLRINHASRASRQTWGMVLDFSLEVGGAHRQSGLCYPSVVVRGDHRERWIATSIITSPPPLRNLCARRAREAECAMRDIPARGERALSLRSFRIPRPATRIPLSSTPPAP